VSTRRTQCDRVLEVLRDGREHPTIEFVDHRILRLPARVHDLRRRGHVIEVRRVGRGLFVYRLVSSTQTDLAPSHHELADLADYVEPLHAQLELSDPTSSRPAGEEAFLAEVREAIAEGILVPVDAPAHRLAAGEPSRPSDGDDDVELPSLEERRRIVAEARAALALTLRRDAS